ncbi:F-box only protein 41 [Hyla sarda]|uniref:F-box only protein 41 n=1 Tax=Hyla sarda TaxID=327740 RepID=UPI0024C2A8D2|nr:F-box only protein 41 [Hyla sarda]XP_056408029.1 F-box only protein 41 [Hyla sarda]XP_056408038.1 F-box only protein 41 [Hyla sarda]XP_056408046.1 F-box only protein 41 [Hyla sarda]
MASLDLPYRCPRCGEHKRFRSLSSLRAHLEYNHTYETLYVLSKTNSICDAAVFPLTSETALLTPAHRREVFESTSFQGKEQRFTQDIVQAEDFSQASTTTTTTRFTQEVEIPLGEIFTKTTMASPPPAAVAAAAAASAAVDAAYEEGLARLKVRAFEKLEVDKRLEKLTEEVEQKIATQVGRLQVELERKSTELEKAKQESVRLGREKQELEDRASELTRQVDVSVEMLASLKQDLVQKEQELTKKQQEVVEIDLFLKETASREANAKVRLQQFIEELLDRADRAEKQLQIISSCGTTPNGSLSRCSIPGYKVSDARVQGSRQRADRHQGPGSSTHGSYPVNQRSSSCSGVPGRVKTVSQSSGCYDSDGAEHIQVDDGLEAPRYSGNSHVADSSFERNNNSRSSGLRRQAIHNLYRRPYRNSTEGEDGDISDVGSRTTESEAELWEQESIGSADLNTNRSSGACRPKGRCDGRMLRPEKGSPSRANEVISPEILKMRAALFCIFTYLDTKTLLRVAEVSRDWKFVARHPAVWTRVFLENARVSPKFLVTLSQWCTQTHSLTLQNLKPRQRGKKETKEEYMKSTRGCLEAGLESLLKATGGNLLILRISHCPNILTDRSLWLASCYCRALQAVTYRSATDPVGHEVIWALGAGCRDIISLQVAPLHPCQQPTRFSNRCLQMIGRCWPHLRALGVGGAGCGVQGLSSLARNCMRLQVLELDHVTEINQEVAAEVCREGLKGLEMLVLTSTPVTPKALLHFNSVCRNLKSIVVQVGIADYFKDPSSQEAQKLFEEMVNKLQALKKRPGFSKILHIKVEEGC